MTHLRNKSKDNLKGAKTLQFNKIYAPSVHCSYYSNIQLMLHILQSDFKKTEKQIDAESKKGSKDEHGFHNWLKSQIARELFSRNYKVLRDFNNFFGQLKALRVKADYKNFEIIENVAKASINKAKLINEILIENFTL